MIYEKGRFYKATVYDEDAIVMYADPGDERPWHLVGRDWIWLADDRVTNLSPLVVLDLSAGEARMLVHMLRKDAQDDFDRAAADDPHVHGRGLASAEVRRRTANQIEEQTRPPRIPEPGLWGVVEAAARRTGSNIPQTNRRHWSRDEGGWAEVGGSFRVTDFKYLVDPVLVRPGIGDEA